MVHTYICWLTYTENKNKKIKVQVNFYWLLFVSQYPDKKIQILFPYYSVSPLDNHSFPGQSAFAPCPESANVLLKYN